MRIRKNITVILLTVILLITAYPMRSEAESIVPLSRWTKTADGCWRFIVTGKGYLCGWHKINGKWYFLNNQYVGKYTDKNGNTYDDYYQVPSSQMSWLCGEMRTGWVYDDGTPYYGWAGYEGKACPRYKDDMNIVKGMGEISGRKSGKWYYLMPEKGYMVTGWKNIEGYWYFFKTSGEMSIGWKKVQGKWYFFESDGHCLIRTKKTINGITYQFDANGVATW